MINKPDYNNSIVNLSNSILKRFNVEPFHNSLDKIDELIKDKKKIIVFLFDGLGKCIIEKHLKEDSFLRKHKIMDITSTMPPTTVASTNAFLSAKYPSETGWLGWTQYFSELDKSINVFTNYIDNEHKQLEGDNYMKKVASYPTIADLINQKHGNNPANLIFGYPVDKENKKVKKLKSFIKYAYEVASSKDESFTYAYWCSPDCLMHKFGTTSFIVHQNIKRIEKLIKHYSKKHKDVTTILISDHGMKDVKFIDMNQYPDLIDTLVRPSTFEKRCANFYVKKGRNEDFEKLFKKYYGKHYELFTIEDAIKENLFGIGKPSNIAKRFFGDYIAISKDEYSLDYINKKDKKRVKFKGHHAGGTLEEMMISIIGIEGN